MTHAPTDAPSPLRHAVFALIAFCMALAAAEAFVWAIWAWRGGPARLRAYKEDLASARSYRFFDPPGVALPVPGSMIVQHKRDFTDRLLAKDALGLGVGLFDDGAAPRPVKAWALGDSFTRGVGSEDPLANGWVELVEKRLPWLDLVNLGLSGTGTLQQAFFYERLAPLSQHDWVVLCFYTGNDFVDNAEPFDWNRALKSLPPGEDPSAVFTGIQEALAYERGPDFLLRSPVKSRMVWAGMGLAQALWGEQALPRRVREGLAKYAGMKAEARNPQVPEEVRSVGAANMVGARMVPRGGSRRADVWLYPYMSDDSQARTLSRHSALLIHDLNAAVRRRGARLAVVVFPTMWEVCLSNEEWASLKADPHAARAMLEKELDRDLPLLDLTEGLRADSDSCARPFYWASDDHPNPAGYAAAADRIAAFLEARIPRPASRAVPPARGH
ncbi:MAG: SGNH/GDSL hydrolase family protein [Elusimicrobiota bacterium]|jgi:lysophospholipase L1-like esterase